MTAKEFVKLLKGKGFNFFTGVPCSLLGALIKELETDTDFPYIAATREDGAVGMAAGAYMAGRLPVVLMQNSGLGYCLNAFTSLNLMYKLPVLVIIGWRGYMGKDAPEHLIMGEACTKLLDDIGLPYSVLEAGSEEKILSDALDVMKEQGVPYGILLRKGILAS